MLRIEEIKNENKIKHWLKKKKKKLKNQKAKKKNWKDKFVKH